MADLNTKYLDYTGLGIFLSKLKEYIENRISEINGTNLNLRASGEDNPTLTSQIEDLWAAIGSTDGSGGSIIENIEKILGEYVKSISTPTEQSLPLKLVIIEGTEDNKDRFTIELQDNGLNDTLSTLTSARVSKITPANDGGAVTLTVDNNTGDVKITVNSKALTERIETLESRSGKYNARSGNGYLLVGTGNDNNSDWCSINASKLRYTSVYDGCELSAYGKMAIGTDFYGGICLGTLSGSIDSYINIAPNHPFKGINIGSGNISIGSDNISISSGNINIGASFASMGTVRIGFPGKHINLIGDSIVITGNEIIIGQTARIGNVIVGTSALSDSSGFPNNSCIEGNLLGTAENSLALGGHSSDYFATASSHTTLKERVDSLESDRIKSVTEGESKENYLTLDVSTSDLNTTITIDDTSLKEKIDEMDEEMDTFAKSESIPTKLPNPNPITVKWKDTSNATQSISYDGADTSVVDLTGGVYYAKTSTNSTNATNAEFIGSNTNNVGGMHQPVYINGGKPTAITIDGGTSDTENCLLTEAKNSPNQIWSTTGITANYSKKTLTAEGGFVGNLQGNATTSTTSSDSEKLGGQLPSYYATKSDLSSTNENVQGIQNSYVKDIKTSNSNTGTKYVTISPSTATKNNVTITIDDSAVREKFESIDNYTINSKKISDSPTLTGDDITLGKSVGDNDNYPTSLDISDAIKKLRESISALGKVVELKGILTSLPSTTTGYEDGDMIIVGNKEYVCFNSVWYLLGDTTQLGEDLSSLISIYNSHKHSVTAKGTVTNVFSGGTNTTKSISGLQQVSNITEAGTLPTKELVEVAGKTHTHTTSVTAKGRIENTFTGGTNTTKSISGLQQVSNITEAGTLPTKELVEVAGKTHTHTTSVTAKGRIENTFTGNAIIHNHTFTGNQNTTSSNSLTISYSAGKLSITSAHTHTLTPTGTISDKSITPTGTVTSTFIGEAVSATSGAPSVTEEIGSITEVGTLPTYTNVEVASGTHTHTLTPTGTVTSTFTGETVSATSGAPSVTEEIGSITEVGTLPTYTNVEVASGTHTHTLTPTGTVTSTFTGEEVLTGEPNSTK